MKEYVITKSDGSTRWYYESVLHREDGPAVIYDGADLEIWVNLGMWHRDDGPAFIRHSTSYCEWWVYDRRMRSSSQYQQATGITDEQIAMLILKYGEIM